MTDGQGVHVLRRLLITGVAGVLGAGVLAGCSSSDDANTVSVTTKEYEFEGAPEAGSTIKGGRTTFEVDNAGSEYHIVVLSSVSGDHDDADVLDAVNSDEDTEWIGPGPSLDTLGPGEKVSLTTDLEPGKYFMACFLPDPQGTGHEVHGMVSKIFTVEGDSGDDAPDADATVQAVSGDDAYEVPKLSPGRKTLALSNKDADARGFFFVRMPEGKTVEDLGALFESDEPLAPPYENYVFQGGTTVEPGGTAWLEIDLKTGTHVVVDTNSDEPKFVEFEVS